MNSVPKRTGLLVNVVVCALSVALTACSRRSLTLEMPETNLQEYAPRNTFDPVLYLESLRIVSGPLAMSPPEKQAIAAFVYDAYHYPLATNVDYVISAHYDLVKLVNANYMPTNQFLPASNGWVRVSDVVGIVEPYIRGQP